MIIEFTNPNVKLKGELRSKLIDPNSVLYKHLTSMKNFINSKYGFRVSPSRMDFHIELIKSTEEPDQKTLISRARQAEGQHTTNYAILNKKAFVLIGPVIEGYGQTHITIAYFREGCPEIVELINHNFSV